MIQQNLVLIIEKLVLIITPELPKSLQSLAFQQFHHFQGILIGVQKRSAILGPIFSKRGLRC